MNELIKTCRCQRAATFFCKCSDFFCCKKHLFAHLKEKKTHHINRITDQHLIKQKIDQNMIERVSKRIQSIYDELAGISQSLINFVSTALENFEIHSNLLQEKLTQMKSSNFFNKSIIGETHSILKEALRYKKSFIQKLSLFTQQYLKKTPNKKSQKFKKIGSEPSARLASSENISKNKWKDLFYANNIGKITSISLSKNEFFIAFGSEDSTVRVFNLLVKSMECIFMGHLGKVSCVEISNSEKLVISGSEDKTIRFWDLNTKKQLKVLKNNNQTVNWICLSEDDKYLVSSGYDKKAYIWNLENYLQTKTVDLVDIKPIFNSLNTLVHTYQSNLKITSISTLHSISFDYIQKINGFTLTNEKKNALLASENVSSILEIEIKNFKTIRQIIYFPNILKTGYFNVGQVPTIDFMFLSYQDQNIHLIFNKEDPFKTSFINLPHTSITPSNKSGIFYFSTNNTLECFKISEDQIETITTFTYIDMKISKFSNNNNLFLYPSFGNQVSVFSIELGQVICELEGHSHQLKTISISQSNSTIITTYSNGELKVWDLRNVSLISVFDSKSSEFTCLCFSKQEHAFAFSSNDKTVTLLDIPNILTFNKFEICLSTVKSLCFFNNDHFLLIGEENGCVRGFDFKGKVQVFMLIGNNNGLVFVRVSDNDQVVIVGDEKGLVKVWDRSKAKMVKIIKEYNQSLELSQKFQEFREDFEKFFNKEIV